MLTWRNRPPVHYAGCKELSKLGAHWGFFCRVEPSPLALRSSVTWDVFWGGAQVSVDGASLLIGSLNSHVVIHLSFSLWLLGFGVWGLGVPQITSFLPPKYSRRIR